jgi:hypothetical protein
MKLVQRKIQGETKVMMGCIVSMEISNNLLRFLGHGDRGVLNSYNNFPT